MTALFPDLLSVGRRWLNKPSAHLVAALLLCLASTSSWALNISTQELPTRSSIQSQLTQINKQETPTESAKAKRDNLEKTLTLLDAIDRVQETAKAQQKTLDAAPAELQKINSQLDELRKPVDSDKLGKQLDALPLNKLENRLTTTLSELRDLQDELAKASSQLTNLQTLPERVQISMSQAYSRSQDIRNQLGGSGAGKTEVTPSLRTKLNTELTWLSMQLELQQQELDNNTNLQDLALKRQTVMTRNIERLEKEVELVQNRINARRLNNTEQTAADAANTTEDVSPKDPLVQKELKTNQQLSQRLINTTEQINQMVQENIKIKGWLDRVTQTERNLNEQISMLKGSLLLSRILYQQRQMLPNPKMETDLDEMIADVRLSQFDINQQRDQLLQLDQYISSLLDGAANKDDKQLRSDLQDALESRKDLLDQLNKQLGSQLNLAINIKLNQQQLQRVNSSLQSTLQQQIFWVSSNKPLDWSWLIGLPKAMYDQYQASTQNVNPPKLEIRTLPALILIVAMLVAAILLRWKRRLLRDKVAQLAKDIGKLNKDTHLHTPKALLLTALELLPGALLIMVFGLLLLLFSNLSTPEVIWHVSLRLTLAFMAFGMLLKILRPGGMAESHFGQSAAEAAYKYRALKYIWRSLIPLIIVATLGEIDPSRLATDAIGQAITLAMLLVTLILIYPTFRSRVGQTNDLVRWLILITMAITPVALMGLVIMGYYYTALKLTNRVIDTFYLFMAWSIVQQTAMRGLEVAARRLAHRRALARRQQLKQQEDVDTTELIEEKSLTIQDVNEQSLRLTKVALFLIFGGCFYWLWSDLVAVLSYLDSIALWHTTTGAAGHEMLQPISLRDLMQAGIFSLVAWVLTKNLPGLLEVVILSRLQLKQGTNYTITTMMSYAITSLGALAALSSLGMSWDKLQWLVAALSVGLGFGLQEIFANFVSGLIILFERPVRIGDVITLGNFSGSVSKIRIRATTVTDFDRKEIIVPNKMFITSQLTNWSLSDTTTRVILKIGVAYGSDLDKTKALLLQAATENTRVMTDPEPVVYFLNFGASTLDHEMRLFVRELGDRNPAVDEINRRIDQLFREHGIEIAFNQVDVYVKNMANNEEVMLHSTQVPGLLGAAGAGASPSAPA